MNIIKLLTLSLFIQLSLIPNVQAGSFGWLKDLDFEARADASGVRARIAARFQIGDAEVRAVIHDVGGHAHAYMVLRLAEMSHMPVDTVIRHYHASKGKGWGVLAKRLGINPGSREFHALKRGHDLPGGGKAKNGKKKSKGNGKGNSSKGGGEGKGKKKY